MKNEPLRVDYPAPSIPKRHVPWFLQMLMVFAVLVVVAVVYSFWRMSQAPSPTLELPGTQDARPAAPSRESSP